MGHAGNHYRIDEWRVERLIARYRPSQTCRVCKRSKPPTFFAPSRIVKRDYECSSCNALRCARDRLKRRPINALGLAQVSSPDESSVVLASQQRERAARVTSPAMGRRDDQELDGAAIG